MTSTTSKLLKMISTILFFVAKGWFTPRLNQRTTLFNVTIGSWDLRQNLHDTLYALSVNPRETIAEAYIYLFLN